MKMTNEEFSLEDVHDPNKKAGLILNWTYISSQYSPLEIQKIVNSQGILGMIALVNEHFKLVYGNPALRIVKQDGRKILIEYGSASH